MFHATATTRFFWEDYTTFLLHLSLLPNTGVPAAAQRTYMIQMTDS